MAKKTASKKARTREATAAGQAKQTGEAEKSHRQRPDRDRRVRQAERMARVLRVLELVQSRGRWNKKAIAEELGCSERTVYRDLEVLEYAGIPYYQEGTEQFIRVRPDYKFPILMLTEEEALGQALATAATSSPGLDVSSGARPVTRKLEALSPGEIKEVLSDAAGLISVLDLKLADHSKHREAIKTVQFALLEGRQLSGLYESPYEEGPIKLRLHPYRLCLIKNAWYVIGMPVDMHGPRTFRVARFKTLRMLDQASEVPEDFDFKAYFGNAWAVFRGEKTYDVEVWFTPQAAKIVTETVWHHTQKAKVGTNGSVTLSFQVDGLDEIANWVLSWAGNITVIRPSELREKVLLKLQAALEMNRN